MTSGISLRARIALLVVVAVIPLVGFSLFKAWMNADAGINRARDNIKSAASLVAADQGRVQEAAHQILLAVAKAPGLLSVPVSECHLYLRTLKAQLPAYTNLGIIGADGHFLCDGVSNNTGVFAGDRDYFQAALSRGAVVDSGYMVGRGTGKPVVTFAAPVESGGKVAAVAFASVDLGEFSKAVTSAALPRSGRVVITDRKGVVLAASPDPATVVGQVVPVALLQEVSKSRRAGTAEGLDSKGLARIFSFQPAGFGTNPSFFVAVSVDKGQVLAPARKQLGLELAVIALVAFLGGWIAWMIAGKSIVAPARQILHATWRVEKGHLDERIPVRAGDSPSEFTRIAAGFNLMADSLEQREKDLGNELTRNRQAYEALELTINSMQEGLMAVDGAGRLILVNDAASRLFAIDETSMVLSPQWPQSQGLFVPGTQTLYAFTELPLYRALQGEAGAMLPIQMVNEREPAGRLINCNFRPMREGGAIVGALMVFSDVTRMEQLQLEQMRGYDQLREVQRKLLNAQRLGRIGNWELDLKTGQLWWSDEVYELFGLTPDEFDHNPDTVTAMIHPDDRAGYILRRDEAMRAGLGLDVEYRIITPAGQTRWIHQIGELYADDRGTPLLRAGVVQDITRRKVAEQAAARTTELLQRTGDMGKIGGWEVVLDGMQAIWSEQIYRIHEVELGVVVSAAEAMAFYAPEVRHVMNAAAQAAVEHGIPWDLELPMITATGRRIWVKTQGRALWRDGKVERLVGALQDITEKHESEEQLRLLETAIARLNDIVLITEAESVNEPGPRIVFVNDAFEHRTGYRREEVLGRSPRFLQGPGTQRDELDRIGAALRNWQPVRAELINYTKSGQEFWLELDIVPITNASGQYTHWVAVERDITRRKLAEQALVNSEQRYAVLFKSAPVPMWIIDIQTQMFIAVNEACVQRYGYTRDEFLTMTIFDIRSAAESRRLRAELASGMREDINRRRHRARDGSEFDVETVSRTIQYEGREARFVVAMDVTAQVRAEKEVQDYLFTLQRSADATQVITSHRTVEATAQETADQVRAVVGAHQAVVSLTAAGEHRRAVNAVSHSDRYAHCRDMVRLAHSCGLDAQVCGNNRPMRLTQAELEALPLWTGSADDGSDGAPMRGWLAVPLTGRSGENMGLLQLSDKYDGDFTLQDQYVAVELAQLASIAIENARLFEQVQGLNLSLEEKVAERTAALTRQEALFRALAEQAPQVVWNADPSGKLTYLNRKWYELMGGKPEDWMGDRWMAAIHPDDLGELAKKWELSRRSLKPYEGMRRLLAADGNYHTMAYRGSPVLDENGNVLFWVGIDADVTEIKSIETALRLSNQELEAFSYSVSHDLRSPLNTVDGFSRLLAKQLDASQPNEKIQHYLSRIQAGVAQMGRLIEDLLSLAQVSRMQLRHENVDLSAISREIADECRGRQPERVATIHIEEGLQVQGDGRLVRVVMENLLGNAWKFSSRQAHAEIRVGRTIDAAGLAVFFVQDNGAGFDMAYSDKLFNTFQRLHAVTEFPGTGVGLATVSRVIGRHGGRVWAEAEPGKGATFFFTLPAPAVAS